MLERTKRKKCESSMEEIVELDLMRVYFILYFSFTFQPCLKLSLLTLSLSSYHLNVSFIFLTHLSTMFNIVITNIISLILLFKYFILYFSFTFQPCLILLLLTLSLKSDTFHWTFSIATIRYQNKEMRRIRFWMGNLDIVL